MPSEGLERPVPQPAGRQLRQRKGTLVSTYLTRSCGTGVLDGMSRLTKPSQTNKLVLFKKTKNYSKMKIFVYLFFLWELCFGKLA